MSTIARYATALLIVASLPCAASADLIVYEGFNYGVPGIVAGQNGGWGWPAASEWQTPATSLALASPGLAHPVVVHSGNTARDTSTGQDRIIYRTWDSDPYVDDGSVLWFSFLFNTSTSATGSELRVFPLGGTAFTSGTGVMMWRGGASSGTITARSGSTNSADSLIYTHGETNLVVGRLEFSDTVGQDSIRVWLNPALDQEPTTGYIESTGNFPSFASGGNPVPYNVYVRGGTNWIGEFDEFRIGTTFASVIPEPGGLLLLLTGGLVVLLRRRRR